MKVYSKFSREELEESYRRSVSRDIPDPLNRTFYFTNDSHLEKKKKALLEIPPKCRDKDCALIIGPGAILSFVELLPKVVILTDKDPYLLMWIQLLLMSVSTHKTVESFEHDLLFDETIDSSERLPNSLLSIEKESLGKEHFLYDQENYERAQEAIQQRSFIFIEIDFSSDQDISELEEILDQHDLKITFANTTNLHSFLAYLARYNKTEFSLDDSLVSFAKLPFDDSCVFIVRSLDEEQPYIAPQIGIDNYKAVVNNNVGNVDRS